MTDDNRSPMQRLRETLLEWEIEEMTPEEIRAELEKEGVDIEAETAKLREKLQQIRESKKDA